MQFEEKFLVSDSYPMLFVFQREVELRTALNCFSCHSHRCMPTKHSEPLNIQTERSHISLLPDKHMPSIQIFRFFFQFIHCIFFVHQQPAELLWKWPTQRNLALKNSVTCRHRTWWKLGKQHKLIYSHKYSRHHHTIARQFVKQM